MNANDRLQDALRVLRELTDRFEADVEYDSRESTSLLVATACYIRRVEGDDRLADVYTNAKKVLEDWRYERE